MKKIIVLFSLISPLLLTAQGWTWVKAIGPFPSQAAPVIDGDADGNAYVAGLFSTSLGFGGCTVSDPGTALFLGKISSQGDCQWAIKLPGTYIYMHNVMANGVFVQTFNPADSTVFIGEISPSGTTLWSRSYKGDFSPAGNVTIDAQGNMYALINFHNTVMMEGSTFTGNSKGSVLVKYSSSGTTTWINQVGNAFGSRVVTYSDKAYVLGTTFTDTTLVGTKTLTGGDNLGDYFAASFMVSDGTFFNAGLVGSAYKAPAADITIASGNIFLLLGELYAASKLIQVDENFSITSTRSVPTFTILTSNGVSAYMGGDLDSDTGCTGSSFAFAGVVAEVSNGESFPTVITVKGSAYLKSNPVNWINLSSSQMYVSGTLDTAVAFGNTTLSPFSSGYTDYIGAYQVNAPAAIASLHEPGGWQLFPNPAGEELQLVHTGNAMGDVKLSIYNSRGENVLQQEFRESEGQQSLSIRNFPAGLYLVNIESQAGGERQLKFIKE